MCHQQLSIQWESPISHDRMLRVFELANSASVLVSFDHKFVLEIEYQPRDFFPDGFVTANCYWRLLFFQYHSLQRDLVQTITMTILHLGHDDSVQPGLFGLSAVRLQSLSTLTTSIKSEPTIICRPHELLTNISMIQLHSSMC